MHAPADRIRNVALVGHRGSGKTSLFEALLFEAGAVTRLGTVVDGTTVSDADPDEQSRQMSIGAACNSFTWKDRRINLLDTPGHQDFSEDTYRVLTAVDAVVMVIDAAKGVEAQTIKLLEVCRLRDTPIAPGIAASRLDLALHVLKPRLRVVHAALRPERDAKKWVPVFRGNPALNDWNRSRS